MKKLIITTLAVVTVSLSSCLKDKPNVDFTHTGTIVEFLNSGLANFSQDAITSADDTIQVTFQANVDGNYPPSTDTKVSAAVDTTLIASYEATNSSVVYQALPAGSYVLNTTSVTIKGGTRLGTFSLTIYKNQLDPSKSYMLPVKITSSNQPVSGNLSVHYFHFIGNDFAGTYEEFYTRYETPDTTLTPSSNRVDEGTIIVSPVSPSEVNVTTGYYTAPNYSITFTKTGTGASALYSNWQVKFVPAEIAAGTQWGDNITIGTSPKFVPKGFVFSSSASYTYAQSLQLFRIYFTTSRGIIDEYVHL